MVEVDEERGSVSENCQITDKYKLLTLYSLAFFLILDTSFFFRPYQQDRKRRSSGDIAGWMLSIPWSWVTPGCVALN